MINVATGLLERELRLLRGYLGDPRLNGLFLGLNRAMGLVLLRLFGDPRIIGIGGFAGLGRLTLLIGDLADGRFSVNYARILATVSLGFDVGYVLFGD